jgi:hypothetical protein
MSMLWRIPGHLRICILDHEIPHDAEPVGCHIYWDGRRPYNFKAWGYSCLLQDPRDIDPLFHFSVRLSSVGLHRLWELSPLGLRRLYRSSGQSPRTGLYILSILRPQDCWHHSCYYPPSSTSFTLLFAIPLVDSGTAVVIPTYSNPHCREDQIPF